MAVLYVVATPIGNLQDLSPRAVSLMRDADLIAAEDTRVTMKLCQVFDIHTKLTSCHRHNEDIKGDYLAELIREQDMNAVLVTDAGTPCISDPGFGLVKACTDRGIKVVPVPGCCAAVAALSVCGFDTREFAFYGFLPREKKDLKNKLQEISEGVPIAVLHESPHRIVDLTDVIHEILPDSEMTVCCDLTKVHESILRGSPETVLQQLKNNPKTEKGEYCIVLDLHNCKRNEESIAVNDLSLEGLLADCMSQGLTLREAQDELILQGKKKNAVKQAALNLKSMFK